MAEVRQALNVWAWSMWKRVLAWGRKKVGPCVTEQAHPQAVRPPVPTPRFWEVCVGLTCHPDVSLLPQEMLRTAHGWRAIVLPGTLIQMLSGVVYRVGQRGQWMRQHVVRGG